MKSRSLAVPMFSRRALVGAMGGAMAAGVLPAAPLLGRPLKRPRIVVVGAGIAGLVAALEIERHGGEAIILEARERVGGKIWTLRGGDRISHIGGDDQIAEFSPGLYLNAGAARIPSHHDAYLHLARQYGVPLEVVVNGSRSAFLASAPAGSGRLRIRQAVHDLRGHFSELLGRAVRQGSFDQAIDPGLRKKLVAFLRLYGDLADDGHFRGSARSGLAQAPGATIEAAIAVPPLSLDELLANPELQMILFEENILMQPTMLQPVGGMDRLPVAVAKALRRPPRLQSEVLEIRRDGAGVRIIYRDRRTGQHQAVLADRAIITTPLPVLARTANDFSPAVKNVLASARSSHAIKIAFEAPPFWEADQVYGGLSFPGGDTGMIWYPSGAFQAPRQILLAAYALPKQAVALGAHSHARQIEMARAAVERLHPGHGGDLTRAVLVQWEKIPFSEGPWLEEDYAEKNRASMATMNAGDGPFYFAGSDLSQYSGHWQEGAILSARHAVQLLNLEKSL